jgi:hypothetical protein
MWTELYNAVVMEHVDACQMIREWRQQELAHFARRAHRHLGRGFVFFDDSEAKPVYITWLTGAPQCLVDMVWSYDPAREAVIVSEDDEGVNTLDIDCVRIQSCH